MKEEVLVKKIYGQPNSRKRFRNPDSKEVMQSLELIRTKNFKIFSVPSLEQGTPDEK